MSSDTDTGTCPLPSKEHGIWSVSVSVTLKNRDIRIHVCSAIRKIQDVRIRIRSEIRDLKNGYRHEHSQSRRSQDVKFRYDKKCHYIMVRLKNRESTPSHRHSEAPSRKFSTLVDDCRGRKPQGRLHLFFGKGKQGLSMS
jgi:hypothetical protein